VGAPASSKEQKVSRLHPMVGQGERNSKTLTYRQWCAPPTTRALVMRSPYTLPNYMFLDLPCDVIDSVAQFRLRVQTLCYETATRDHRSTTRFDRCEVNDTIQDEQHAVFHCTHTQVPPVVSLRRKDAHLFSLTGSLDVSAFKTKTARYLPFPCMDYLHSTS